MAKTYRQTTQLLSSFSLLLTIILLGYLMQSKLFANMQAFLILYIPLSLGTASIGLFIFIKNLKEIIIAQKKFSAIEAHWEILLLGFSSLIIGVSNLFIYLGYSVAFFDLVWQVGMVLVMLLSFIEFAISALMFKSFPIQLKEKRVETVTTPRLDNLVRGSIYPPNSALAKSLNRGRYSA